MNSVSIIGRLTKDPVIRYTQSQMAIANFSVAINRGKDKDGNDKGADFPNVKVFGKQAENCEKYLAKGRLVGIQGHIQTGSYTDKDDKKVYTTDVIADRVEFLDWGENQNGNQHQAQQHDDMPQGFAAIDDDDDIPF